VSERESKAGARRRERDDAVPTAERSWERHVRIRDLLEQIREGRARKRVPDVPTRPR
jgi:hypothetical protein